MKGKSNRFQRQVGKRSYKKLFFIFVEGNETEPRYFNIFRASEYSYVHLQIKSHLSKTHPKQVLTRAKRFIKAEKLKKNDQVWLVIDHDGRPEEDFQSLNSWSDGKNYFLAISKPCFEFWLLLHFEKGDQVRSFEDCRRKLKKHLPNYEKNQFDEKGLKTRIPIALKMQKISTNNQKAGKKQVIQKCMN
jgi:RloB-like protein